MKVGEPRPADARTPRPPRQRLLQESRRRTDFSAAYKDSCRPGRSARPQHDERERCTSPTRVGLTRSSDLGGRLTVLFPEFTGNVETYYGRRTQVIMQPPISTRSLPWAAEDIQSPCVQIFSRLFFTQYSGHLSFLALQKGRMPLTHRGP